MPFSASINFRSTAGYVTDAAGQTYCLADPYPTTRAGLTFGWSVVPQGVNRSTDPANVPELAGVNYAYSGSGAADFQLDLPAAGTYSVRLALGDAGFSQTDMYCKILDGPGGTTLATVLAGVAQAADQYWDATGVLRTSPAAWRADNQAATVTATGTSLVVRIAAAGGGPDGYTTIAHLEAADAGAPALAAGTASFVHSGPAGIAVSAAVATGGTAPYTYQWQRNSGGGSYSNLTNGGGVSGATTLALTDGSAVAGTLYGYRLVVTDSSATPATATSNAVTAQVYPGGALGSGGFPLIGPGGLVG
jgi:hypothetical protein